MGAKEVAAGASWLDSNFPGWEREIDLGTLRMASCSHCVLGQALDRLVTQSDIYEGAIDGYLLGYNLYDRQFEEGVIDGLTHALLENSFSADSVNEKLWVQLLKERFSTGNLSG